MSHLKFLVFFIVITALNASCDGDKCRSESPLREGISESIPYKNGTTVKFETNEGETFSVTVARKEEILKNDLKNCEEYLEILLSDPKSTYPFMESIQRGLSVDSMFQMSVSPRRRNGTGTIVQFALNNRQELIGLNHAVSNGLYQATRLPTLQIGTKTYKDVLKLDYTAPLNDDSVLQFLYNKEFGVLQVRTKSGYTVTQIN